MLTSHKNGSTSSSHISELDKLLKDYESEYHYLFHLVHEAAKSEAKNELQQNYFLPNIARRLLESFLGFRQPSQSGNLHQQINQTSFDNAKKISIHKFLNFHSHPGQICDPEHDPSILIETKQFLNDLLDLIKNEDKQHFDEMKRLMER